MKASANACRACSRSCSLVSFITRLVLTRLHSPLLSSSSVETSGSLISQDGNALAPGSLTGRDLPHAPWRAARRTDTTLRGFGHREVQMDNTTLLIILIILVIVLGGGWYGRGRWF